MLFISLNGWLLINAFDDCLLRLFCEWLNVAIILHCAAFLFAHRFTWLNAVA